MAMGQISLPVLRDRLPGIMVATKGDRIVAVKGDPAAPVNMGLLHQGIFHAKIIYGADRLTEPLMRVNEKGEFDKKGKVQSDHLEKALKRWQSSSRILQPARTDREWQSSAPASIRYRKGTRGKAYEGRGSGAIISIPMPASAWRALLPRSWRPSASTTPEATTMTCIIQTRSFSGREHGRNAPVLWSKITNRNCRIQNGSG